jgi:hypothetical protein
MVWGYFPMKKFCGIFRFLKVVGPKRRFKNFSGVIYISARVNDPAEIDQELINCLLKETVCMAFCLLYFRQLVKIWTTPSYNHFAGHYKLETGHSNGFLKPISVLSLTTLKFEHCRFSQRMRNGLRP